MQTILGAGGAIGIELAKVLPTFTNKIRLVGRNPQKVNDADELFKADLANSMEVLKAVAGSNIVYLTVGLPYNFKVWKQEWPLIMKNVLEACKVHQAKLVFFDNIYMYDGSVLNPITENSPINPPSKKGTIRALIAKMLWDAVETKEVQALIARSADFYGPAIDNTSMLTETVFKPLSQGKKANWMGSSKYKHSFTYTLDAVKATALLGNTPSAYGQVWHLPTAPDPFTGREWVNHIAQEMGVEPKYREVPKFMVKIMGLFVPIMKEMVEMMYQYDRDYIFDSSKFEKQFKIKPTPYLKGIREIIKTDYVKK